jgi:hypothetical protein
MHQLGKHRLMPSVEGSNPSRPSLQSNHRAVSHLANRTGTHVDCKIKKSFGKSKSASVNTEQLVSAPQPSRRVGQPVGIRIRRNEGYQMISLFLSSIRIKQVVYVIILPMGGIGQIPSTLSPYIPSTFSRRHFPLVIKKR